MHVSSLVPVSHPAIPEEPALEAHNAAMELRIYFEHVLMDLRHYVDRESVTLGESRGADIFLASEGLPSERFPLLRRAAGRQLLTFSAHMRGEVEIDGVVWPLNALVAAGLAQADPELPQCYCLLLGINTRVLIHWAGATLAMRFVARTRPPARAGHTFDLHYLNTLCASVFLHVTLIVTLLLHPYDAQALAREKLIDVIIELAPRQMPVPVPRPVPPPKTPAKATPSETPPARPLKDKAPRGLRMGPGLNKDLLRQELREL
ncbi:MAG: hypothetical protein HYZ27_02545, partial [Deltaproteobacteria bacterium]|nr:hypothetical protein [Deltaproteobacteria bacterium]